MFQKYAVLCYNRFPNEFFAKLNICKHYGFNGELDKVKNIFGDSFSLKYAFPNKKMYHQTEAINFLIFAIDYTLAIDNLDAAIRFELNLTQLINGQPLHLQVKQRILNYKNENLPIESKEVILTETRKVAFPYCNLSEEEFDTANNFLHRINKLTKPDSNLITEIRIEANKHPKNPHYKDLICEYYHSLEQLSIFFENVQIAYKNHPDFLMSKLRYADLLLSTDLVTKDKGALLKKIRKIFSKELNLHNIYPNAKYFLRFDYIYSQYIFLRIYILKDQFSLADNCLKNLVKLKADTNMIKTCQSFLNQYVDSLKLKHLSN